MLGMNAEPRQVAWVCLVFMSAFLAPVSHSIAVPVQPIACTSIQSAMGPFYRWPTPNPGMVAPVNVVWNYPVYTNPLRAAFTGKSIQIDIPASFGQFAGFHLGKTGIPTPTDPRFRLTRIDIRKPAQAYPGLGQALTHVMEMVLVHRQEKSDRWANVILPFQVSTSGQDMDIVNPIISGTELPSRLGQTGYVMASAVSELKLSPAYANATFSEFWGTAPVSGCTSKTVDARYFMRTSVLTIGVDTFQQLSSALQNVPVQNPTPPPETTWTIGTCHNSTSNCVLQKAMNVQEKADNAAKYESQAIETQRKRKSDLDTKLTELQAHTGPATNASIALYDATAAAFSNLQAAASELASAQTNKATTQAWASQAAAATWDSNAPRAAALQTGLKSQANGVALTLADISGKEAEETEPSVVKSLLSRFFSTGPSKFRQKRRLSV